MAIARDEDKKKKKKPLFQNSDGKISEGIATPFEEMEEPSDRVNAMKGGNIKKPTQKRKKTHTMGGKLPTSFDEKVNLQGKEQRGISGNPQPRKGTQQEENPTPPPPPEYYRGENLQGMDFSADLIEAPQERIDQVAAEMRKRGYDVPGVKATQQHRPGLLGIDNGDAATVDFADAYFNAGGAANPADYGLPTKDEFMQLNNSQVKKWQDKLKKAGYDLGEYGKKKDGIDGKQGERTWFAMRRYANDLARKERENDEISKINPLKPRNPQAEIIDFAKKEVEQGRNPLPGIVNPKPQYPYEKEKRIQNAGRWSAIGEALRNVIDAAGGNQGADIWKHQYSPLRTVTDNLTKMQQQYAADMDDYEQAQRENAIRERGYEFKSGENQKNRDFKREQSQNQFEQQLQLLGAKTIADRETQLLEAEQRRKLDELKNQDKKDYAKYKAQLDARLDDHYTNNDFSLALQKAAMDADKNSSEDGFFQVTNGNGQQVDIPEGTYYDIINRIMEDVNSGAITDDPDLNNDMSVLELALEGNGSKNALNIKVAQYYDKYYKQDPQTGKMVSRDYAQQRDQQFEKQLMQDVEQDIQDAGDNNEAAINNIAATLIANGSYEQTPEGKKAAISEAKELYQKVKSRNKNTHQPWQQEEQPTSYDIFDSGVFNDF